jgi:hypothetical protein|tara:strand:- start:279 stop:638 length:360 start_codon:yes stop_codon:yes gene_type:complete
MDSFVSFHNPLKEDFTFRWDKKPYTIPAGDTIPLEPYLAKHGSKHLVDYIILHPKTWAEVGIERTTSDLGQGRDELFDKILDTAKITMVTKKVDVPVAKVSEDKPVKEKEKEFEDLNKS